MCKAKKNETKNSETRSLPVSGSEMGRARGIFFTTEALSFQQELSVLRLSKSNGFLKNWFYELYQVLKIKNGL